MGTQRTALVTGGASGIGLATSFVLLETGWRVAIAGRSRRAFEVASKDMQRTQVRFYELDVTDEADVAAALTEIARDFGPLRGVVNCAGIELNSLLQDTSAEVFRRMLDVNLTGSFLVTREAVRSCMRVRWSTLRRLQVCEVARRGWLIWRRRAASWR